MKPTNRFFEKLQKTGKATAETVIGTALTAAAFSLFILPQGFAAAGVTGFCTVISRFLPLPLPLWVFLVNLLFLLMGLLWIGREFTVKTLASSFLFPLFLKAFSLYAVKPPQNPLGSVLIAGILLGTGTGLLLHGGASSGGFSVLGVILQKKHGFPVGVTMNITDAAVILLQVFRRPLPQTIYGILVVSLSAFLAGRLAAAGGISPQKAPSVQASSPR